MRKGLAHIVVIGIIAVLLIGGLGYYAYSGSKKKVVVESTPTSTVSTVVSPSPTSIPVKSGYKRITVEEMVFDVSSTWQEKITDLSSVNREYAYTDSTTGNYFNVIVSVGGGDTAADAYWHYKLSGNDQKSLQPVREEPDCDPQSVCQIGDGKLAIIAIIDDITNGYKGKIYRITFGNNKTETADRQIYRDILKTASFK